MEGEHRIWFASDPHPIRSDRRRTRASDSFGHRSASRRVRAVQADDRRWGTRGGRRGRMSARRHRCRSRIARFQTSSAAAAGACRGTRRSRSDTGTRTSSRQSSRRCTVALRGGFAVRAEPVALRLRFQADAAEVKPLAFALQQQTLAIDILIPYTRTVRANSKCTVLYYKYDWICGSWVMTRGLRLDCRRQPFLRRNRRCRGSSVCRPPHRLQRVRTERYSLPPRQEFSAWDRCRPHYTHAIQINALLVWYNKHSYITCKKRGCRIGFKWREKERN